ncbi:MAG: hypothetical protein ACKVS6_02390, partial [Planctomycetota bacterium]
KAPDVLVVDHQMERVLPDGSVESEISAVYRINDQTGVDQHGEASFSGELLELKVVHPDGSIDEPTPAKGSYALPNLKPGNFILVRSRVYSEAAPGSTPRLGNFQFQSLERPYVLSQYVLSLPKNSDLRLIERNFDGEHDITESDAEITHQFTKRNSPRIMPERSAPDPMRFLPWVQAGISKTHAQLNRSFRTQLRTMDVSEEIKEAAANAVAAANAKNDRDVAKCLYQFTNDTLLERGGGTATRSLLEKRGNPVALYGALLKARSVPFDYVYVRAIPEGGDDEPEPEFLDASRYHRVLFRIHPREGGEPIWVDVSLKLQPFGERPAALSGSEAFVTNEYNPEIIKLPLLPDDESIPLELLSSFELRGGQTAIAKVQLTLHNEQSWGAREQIRNQTADIKKTIASQISNQFVEGVELINFDFPNMSDASSPLKFIFEGNVNNFLRQGTSGLEAPSVVRPIPLAKQFAGRSKRKLPVRLRVVQLFKENVTVTPGEMQTFGEIPKDVIKNGFGIDYQLRFKQAGGSLMIERTLKLTPVTIPAEDYPSFMALCREIEEAELSKIPVNEKK